MSIVVAEDLRGQGEPKSREIPTPATASLSAPNSQFYGVCKGACDVGFALVLLVLTAPLLALSMLMIKLTSRGPAVYWQTRIGKGGKPFVILKLRTMVHQCESLTGVRWCVPNDNRVTPIGRLLRKTHLDELPQLWNVLKGDMSLIGPRPERPEFLPQLEQAIPNYRGRLLVKPGVTGFAQVQLPPDTDLASVRKKLGYDLYYVKHAGIWLDFRIFLSTAGKVACLPYRTLRAVFFLPSPAAVECENQKLPRNTSPSAARRQAV